MLDLTQLSPSRIAISYPDKNEVKSRPYLYQCQAHLKLYLLTALLIIAASANGSLTTYDVKYHSPSAALLENNITINNGYQYNPDGIRTQAIENGVVSNFLIDGNRDYAQVVAEVDSASAVSVEYIYGDDLIGQDHQASGYSYYLYDGLGSTRRLTDSQFKYMNVCIITIQTSILIVI